MKILIIRKPFKLRLSLMMTLNNEYPFQTTAKISSLSPYLKFTILLYKYRLPYLPTYQKIFCPNFFFGKSLAGGYPTYLQFGHMSKVSQFFLYGTLSLGTIEIAFHIIIIIIIILFAKLTSYIKNIQDTTIGNRLTNVQRCCNSRGQL